jgi:hypothetical protein
MDTTENTEKVETTEGGRSRFSLLVLMASLLSLGSLAWTTWSLLDLFQVDALRIEKLGNVSLIGLSAAVTMDIVWSATMYAEYKGQKIPVSWKTDKGRKTRSLNTLPLIGWTEVLFVAGLLGYHGSTVAGGAAMFGAVLPIFTKLTWVLALNGLKDPYELTDDEKAMIAAKKRKSRLTRADADATAEQHEAEQIKKAREHDAALADQKRQSEIERENTFAAIEKKKIEQQAEFDLEKADLEGAAENKLMRQRLNAQLQIETMRTQQGITLERLSAEQELRIAAPLDLGFNVIQGRVSRPQLSKGSSFEEDDIDILNEMTLDGLDGMELSDADRRKATMAARYFAADATEGGVTKAAFAKANRTGAPRVTEATTAFPLEWFVERGLATWQS